MLIKYNAYEGIDNLSEAVEEAKQARLSSSAAAQDAARGKDAWRPELAPRTAVHAITVPLLEAERLRLERDLAEVSRLRLLYLTRDSFSVARWKDYRRKPLDDSGNTETRPLKPRFRYRESWIGWTRCAYLFLPIPTDSERPGRRRMHMNH